MYILEYVNMSLNSIKRLIFVIANQCIFREKGTKLLNISTFKDLDL